ncbi:hypothetical protein J4Q44_G00248360 [Coregonus suidteri]|uniref:isoleucine--tRNA ligase n=1 Tax=Coregonus suidteri TaxID=861788 RepID=A0AAN8QGV2_9TELE
MGLMRQLSTRSSRRCTARTALAEAKLEYSPQHVSKEIYATFALVILPTKMAEAAGELGSISVLVWTTQPWTIPANQAICFISNAHLATLLGTELESVGTFTGAELEGGVCQHPTIPGKEVPLLPANLLTMGKGTGLVHTAPAHSVASQFKLTGEEECVHSYPYDWGSKQPVIIQPRKQWFINTASLKDKAKDVLAKVRVMPESAKGSLLAQLDRRLYWCISRQRSWGVPIPVFYHKETGEPLLNKHTVSHVAQFFSEKGSDCWWELPLESLLPPEVLKKSKAEEVTDYERGEDVLDIWFDSGTSWAAVLEEMKEESDSDSESRLSWLPASLRKPLVPESDARADVYVEGKDQIGGWFQSSLLTSVGVQKKAPYKALVVHDFVVSEKGEKSLGNLVDPDTVIHGGKDPSVSPAYGVDVLHWWVAKSNVFSEVQIGSTMLNSARDIIDKLRNTLKFLLGNLQGFDPRTQAVDPKEMNYIDQYLLHLL